MPSELILRQTTIKFNLIDRYGETETGRRQQGREREGREREREREKRERERERERDGGVDAHLNKKGQTVQTDRDIKGDGNRAIDIQKFRMRQTGMRNEETERTAGRDSRRERQRDIDNGIRERERERE